MRQARRGQGLAEYALILSLIAIVAIVALIFLGSRIQTIFDQSARTEMVDYQGSLPAGAAVLWAGEIDSKPARVVDLGRARGGCHETQIWHPTTSQSATGWSVTQVDCPHEPGS